MNMPFYVSPEQLMKDRADFAQKGISKGRSLIVQVFSEGIMFCAENPSVNLRKISEIYDRIAFGGVGRYNEYDQLRIAGIRHADFKGYAYSREDVDSQALANQYAQMLGNIFTHEMKPLEVEIIVAAVGSKAEEDQMFHIRYDGSVNDRYDFTVLGGETETITEKLSKGFSKNADKATALKSAVNSLSKEKLKPSELEVGILDRNKKGRCFERLTKEEIENLLA